MSTPVLERQHLDRSTYSVVVLCTCGWRGLTNDAAEAWGIAARHAREVHGNGSEASHNQRKLIQRRAAA